MRKFFNTLGEPFRRFTCAPLKFTLPILAALALVLNIFLEICSRKSFTGAIGHIFTSPVAFLANVFIILAMLCICLFLKRRVAMVSLVSFLWIALGVTNAIVMTFRVSPLSAIDFLIMLDAFSVAGAYFTVFEIALIVVGILLAIALIVLLFIKGPRRDKVDYIRSLISFGIIGAITTALVLIVSATPSVSEDFIGAYNRNGFAYCFSRSIFIHGVDRPDDEAINKKDELMDKLTQDKSEEGKDAPVFSGELSAPNIVVIQLESFFDVKYVNNIELSEDPIPNFTALKENGISGFLNVAHIGGGTANIEFEFLTGMNLDHFGLGEFPYTTILKSRACESLAANLKELDYTAHAIHNHTATFYNRNTVYPYLGFDTFTPLELMTDIERNILTFCTDDVLVGEIESALNTTNTQDFVFAVSVEGHGGYPNYRIDSIITEDDVEVYGIEDEKTYYQYRFYVNLIKQMDETVGRICDMLENRGEPYVLVLYGDHLPSLPVDAANLENGDLYQTEYVIKTNIELSGTTEISDINELDRNLETYQLSAYLQALCGMGVGEITLLHQHEFETGEMFDDVLRTLEYEQLYTEDAKYEPADMVIGTNAPIFDYFERSGNTIYVYGDGFNQYSKVKIAGAKQDTTFIDRYTLKVENVLFDTDEVEVSQYADDGTELAKAQKSTT